MPYRARLNVWHGWGSMQPYSNEGDSRVNRAEFRFYAELNDFLSPERRYVTFVHAFRGRPAVKDQIEALGVPHTEVDLILVNGESVGFDHPLEDGDRVSVYPVFEAFDITPVLRVRPEPLREVRFVLDAHLGRLAAYLRMLGFDALYRSDYEDGELAHLSHDERRILLTRDRGLLKRSIVTHGYCVRETQPCSQLVEVVQHFDLFRLIAPFTRCVRCNGLLERVPKEQVRDRLLPETCRHYDDFCTCRACGRVYWHGPHAERMERLIEHVLAHEPGEDALP